MKHFPAIVTFCILQFTLAKAKKGHWGTEKMTTQIIIGNKVTSKAEIYNVHFECDGQKCISLPVEKNDLVWSSPVIDKLSEVKAVIYRGKEAVLASTSNGAIVFGYPSGAVLFQKEWDPAEIDISVHSVEVLPDGNVVAAGSQPDGIFGILFHNPIVTVPKTPAEADAAFTSFLKAVGKQNPVQDTKATTWNKDIPYGHGVVYDYTNKRLYAGGYLSLFVFKYESGPLGRGKLKVVKNISLRDYYDEKNYHEDMYHEDGVHDLYPIDGQADKLFLTTGEHVYIWNIADFKITPYAPLYTIPSKNSRAKKVNVLDKGGVKAISKDANIGVVFAHSAPWFKEYFTDASDVITLTTATR